MIKDVFIEILPHDMVLVSDIQHDSIYAKYFKGGSVWIKMCI